MDGEDASYRQNNAVAGPSTITQDSSVVFLPPALEYSQPRSFLTSTQDLLARLHLHAAYEKHVRIPLAQSPTPAPSISPSNIPYHPPPDGDDKKKKNSYRHLIRSLPGKHSMKKDDYLTTMMQVPAKQRIPIVAFDARTQREAFTVSAEGLKGWNAGALILESAQAKEDRKKRKELKKLARAQAQGVTPGTLPGTPAALPQSHPAPPHSTIPSAQQPPGISLTPQAKPRVPAVTIPPPGGRSGTTPTPTSATPRSASLTGPPPPGTATPMSGAMRGQKRELEDSTLLPPTPTMHSGSTSAPGGMVSARAGVGAVRPRPVKKQRMDIQGQSREVLVQQPTPQGS
ncbi:hypothetical protein PAXINDRAFT_171458 [Paxillus involutus ATCC 200175]|uniref:Uncharacterized protein n=1 Tax=Paxillus involutus ATCC 200175 TaxID=664439 RepID=A0A0C9TMX0_PAXIN|nr:hypothetical protein PAXINDRAFT_171458 [Paxillus involutus ATCC 200175]